MANFITFDAGQDRVAKWGFPGTCSLDLSTKSIDSTSPFVETDTFASRGVITGTGYAAQTQSFPTPSNGTVIFATATWTTGTSVDWSSTTRSAVLTDGTIALVAWNLQSGGGARALNAANTTENFRGTLVVATG